MIRHRAHFKWSCHDIIAHMNLCESKYQLDETFTVRAYESGVTNHVTLSTLCNYMQEIAGLSADRLGFGILKLQEERCTWMLSRLHIKVARYVPWGENIMMRTWPSGMKGRLIATRCFQAVDNSGNEVLQAHSEWLYVNMDAQRIMRLPESFTGLVPEGTPDIQFEDIGGKIPRLSDVDFSTEVRVRRSDLDFNDHVNNVHYVEWMLESMPTDSNPKEVDIVYRSAAKTGEELASERSSDGPRTFHQIRRTTDNLVLATAAMVW